MSVFLAPPSLIDLLPLDVGEALTIWAKTIRAEPDVALVMALRDYMAMLRPLERFAPVLPTPESEVSRLAIAAVEVATAEAKRLKDVPLTRAPDMPLYAYRGGPKTGSWLSRVVDAVQRAGGCPVTIRDVMQLIHERGDRPLTYQATAQTLSWACRRDLIRRVARGQYRSRAYGLVEIAHA